MSTILPQTSVWALHYLRELPTLAVCRRLQLIGAQQTATWSGARPSHCFTDGPTLSWKLNGFPLLLWMGYNNGSWTGQQESLIGSVRARLDYLPSWLENSDGSCAILSIIYAICWSCPPLFCVDQIYRLLIMPSFVDHVPVLVIISHNLLIIISFVEHVYNLLIMPLFANHVPAWVIIVYSLLIMPSFDDNVPILVIM